LAPDRPQPIRNPRRAHRSWERPSCHGVSGQVLPRARPQRTALQAPVPSPALPLRRSFPGLFPALLFLDREFAVGRVYFSDFAKLLLLFLRSFLGFSLLRHHKPPSKVKEASTAPVELRRTIRPSGVTRRRISCRSTRRAIQNLFSARNSCSLARTNNIAQKIFSSIAHIKQSSKKFLVKNNSVGRSRDARDPALAFAPLRTRASMRVREERILEETASIATFSAS